MACCPEGSLPALVAPNDYTPRGTILSLANSLPVYCVGHEIASTKCLIVFPEVFSWEGRLKGICDTFADQGYLVLMPDLMRGETLANYAHDPDLKNQFLSKWSTWQDLEDDIRTLFSYIDSLGITAIGCLGFCWGVWVGFKASAAGFPLKAGAGAHPSIRLEEYHGSTPEKLSELVNCPMMLASARNDPPNVQEGGEVERILQAKFPQSTVKSFHDVDHGWVSRGDLQDPVVSQNVNDALMAITHFLQQNI